MGAYEWDDTLKQATVLEFLKGDQIKDQKGNAKDYNHRSMFSIATAVPEKVNGKTEIVVSNTNVEFTLNPETFELYGMSEAGTTKVLHYLVNQNVSMTWVRQLNATDAAYPQGYGTEADYYEVKNWARAFALDPNTSCGMMSQQILRNFTPVAE